MNGWKFNREEKYWFKEFGHIEMMIQPMLEFEFYSIMAWYTAEGMSHYLGGENVYLPTDTQTIIDKAEEIAKDANEFIRTAEVQA